MRVKEIMGKPLVIEPDATVQHAAKKMVEMNVTTFMVIDSKKLVGIITDGDIVERVDALGKCSKDILVKEIMSSHLIKVDADESVEYAVSVMLKNNIRRLPVVSNKRLVGMLTLDYVAKHLSEIGIDSWF